MPLLNLTVQHGRTLDDARRGLETAVDRVSGQFGALVRRTEWTPDRERVKLEGAGFWVEMTVDAQAFHATGDIPGIGKRLGSPFGSRLKQIIQATFQRNLPP
jgi:Putative polyhydroxyalkanoic acid system protein (PHA_gran_rgn)